MKNISKNFFSVVISDVIASGLQAAFYLIFATLLFPEFYGELSFLIAIATTASTLSRFGLHYSVEVYRAKKKEEISNQINILSIILTGIVAIILIPINPAVSLIVVGMSLFSMSQYNLLGLKRYSKYLWFNIFKSISIIIIPLLMYFGFDLNGILFGFGISYLVGSYYLFKGLKKNVNGFKELKEKYRVLIHNFGVDSSLILPLSLDKLVIVPLFGFIFTGIYQFNLQILIGAMVLPVILHSFLISEEVSGSSVRRINYFVVFTSILVVLVVISIGPFMIENLFPNFYEGITSLQILIISTIPLSLASILNAKLQAQESTKVGYAGIIRIITLLALIPILGSVFGIEGLSFAFLSSSVLYTIVLYFIFHKTLKN